jgi:dynein heavy chain
MFFPRFYFLSNDELLEILSETKNAHKVQPHLKKIFEGIHQLIFFDAKTIQGMKSNENEVVYFVEMIKPQQADGLVEVWIKELEQAMRKCLKSELLKTIDFYESTIPTTKSGEKILKKSELISKLPAQIVLLVQHIYWTSEVTQVIIK